MLSPIQSSERIFRFDAFEVDLWTGELRKHGIKLRLQEQPLKVLAMLLAERGELVTRERLRKGLWSDDTFVDFDRGLNTAVKRLRAALNDAAEDPRYIETVGRRGYRFIAPVSKHVPVSSTGVASADPVTAIEAVPESDVIPKRPSRTRLSKWLLVAGMSVLGLAFGLYWVARSELTPAREPKATQLTANSVDNPVTSSAISPDGKYLAFTDKTARMHLRLLATGETQTIPEPESFANTSVDWTVAAWFPDSTRFLANARTPASLTGIRDRVRFGTSFQATVSPDAPVERNIWTVAIFGKPPQRLRDDAEAFSVSPDGSLIAFGTRRDSLGDREIWLMDSNGQQARKLLDATPESAVAGFSWSPGGRRATYFTFDGSKGELVSRDLNTGTNATLLSFPDEGRLSDFVSLPDGRVIYAQSDDPTGRSCNLWEVRIDSRVASPRGRQLTNWSGSCAGTMSATSDGKRIAFQISRRQTTVNVGELNSNGLRLTGAKHLTLNDYVNAAETWTPDGKALVFRSIRDGHLRLFRQALDSDAEEPLVLGAENVAGAAVSPEGSWLFYLSCGHTTDECGDEPVPVMRIPLLGGTPQTVLTSDTYGRPRCAVAPSKLCVFAHQNDAGEPIVFTAFDAHGRGPDLARFETEPRASYAWSLSPDGTRIAILKFWDGQIHVLSVNDKASSRVRVKGTGHLLGIYWTADGRGWFTASQTPTGTSLLHVDPEGTARTVWELKGNTVAYGVPSPKGHRLAIVATVQSSNVWLLENF